MIAVIIAGGAGTRLWPLSTNDYPKHLLNLTGDETLLQSTYRRAKRLSDHIYVVTGADHLEHIKAQLPKLSSEAFIVEPDRRETAGCFVVALHHIQSRHNHDEPIAFMHADHYIRDVEGFVHSFKIAQAESTARKQITLVGIEPTYGATGFGYIEKGSEVGSEGLVHEVTSFKEKPDFTTAKQYLESGRYLWNAGYFVGSLSTFLAAMKEYSPELEKSYQKLLGTKNQLEYTQVFLSFKKAAIDYALMEKAKNLLVVLASFDWMDLGSFNDVHHVSDKDELGNHTKGYVELDAVENSMVRNDEPSKPIAVIGLDNIVVVNTSNGLLIARKDLSQNVGKIAKKVQKG